MNKKLELLSLAKEFTISKNKDDMYIVGIGDLEAVIEGDSIEYYITGIYNSGVNSCEIEIEELNKLIKFCNLMIL